MAAAPNPPPPAPGDVVICAIPPRKSMVDDADLTCLPGVILYISGKRESGDRPDDVFVVAYILGDVEGQCVARRLRYVAGPQNGAFCWPRP